MKNKWTVGFDKRVITPEDYGSSPYYLAGFGRGMRVTGVLDDIYVRSVYLSCRPDGRDGIVLAVIDCIGICNTEINEIRARVMRYLPAGSVSSVNIMCTHVHSAPDTQGLWGRGLRCGRNEKHMALIKDITVECIAASVACAVRGRLYFGSVMTENMILDNRIPDVHDDRLNRLRFVPDGGGTELYILNIGCHPELLGENKHLISADWPGRMGRYITEKTGAEFAFFNGAIGAITNMGMDEVYRGTLDGIKAMPAFGRRMGEYALSINDEKEVPARLSLHRVERLLSVENRTFALASALSVVKNEVIKVDAVKYNKGIITEVSLLEIGDIMILMVPGELFPELAIGGFLTGEQSATGRDYPFPPLFGLLPGDGPKLIFGLANDQIGYIIPENDFYVSKRNPYAFWDIPDDSHGNPHYEETTCSGSFASEMLRDAVTRLLQLRIRDEGIGAAPAGKKEGVS